MRAFRKDIIRTIKRERNRLLALTVIAVLGVCMMTGLKAACDDLRVSADTLFDESSLHDLSVVSTLGLTDDDVQALLDLDSVTQASGQYFESVHLEMGDGDVSAILYTWDPEGPDVPYVLEGRLPARADEIAVTEDYLNTSGKQIGDTVTIREDPEEDGKDKDGDGQNAKDKDGDGQGAKEEDSEDDADFMVEEAETPNFRNTSFTIVGSVIDVTSIVNPEGSTSFRSTGNTDYHCFVSWSAVDTDYYTAVNLLVTGAKDQDTFSDPYAALIADAKSEIEEKIVKLREQARYDEIVNEATDKLDEAKQKAEEKLAEAEGELDDAKEELENGQKELADGESELNAKAAQAQAELADGRAEIAKGYKELEEGRKELDDAKEELTAAKEELEAKQEELAAQMEDLQTQKSELAKQKEALTEGIACIEDGLTQIGTGLAQIEANRTDMTTQAEELDAGQAGIEGALALLDDSPESQIMREQLEADLLEVTTAQAELAAGLTALDTAQTDLETQQSELEEQQTLLNTQMEQLLAGEAELLDGETQLSDGIGQVEEGLGTIEENESLLTEKEQDLSDGRSELDAGQAGLESGQAQADLQIASARQELEEARQEFSDGESEYEDGLAAYTEKKEEVEEKLADARKEIDEIEDCDWFIRDRRALDAYADITSDADCIESIGTIFPVLFLLVAILVSLTTITRMVDESRGLIGTYQGLGFTNREINRKFVVFSSVACIAGGILGNLVGYIVLPEIIFVIFRTMYLIPHYVLGYNVWYGIGGILLFFAAIVGATLISCRSTVRQMPAVLLRPKSPQAGSRILLERIRPVWSRMSFLRKVTARNLFRYKKRFLMTVFGIAGCTALLLCGFSIKDTVADLMPKQYEQIISYDILAVTATEDDFREMNQFLDAEQASILDRLAVEVTTVEVKNEAEDSLEVQLYVIPDDADLTTFFTLRSDGRNVKVDTDGFYITENIAVVLGFETGETVTLQDMKLHEISGEVNSVLEYYLGNAVFVTEEYYEKTFGEHQPNALLMKLKEGADEKAFADALTGRDEVLSVSSVQKLKSEFSQAFALMNMVVYVVIVLAGALAFVVLFTLSTTNISERERELATIKALGFYDREVHRYVDKETLILTGIGIAAGMPLGVLLSDLLGMALQMPAIIYRAAIHPVSYFLAAGMALVFAVCVNQITDRVLDRIDPIEALKSVE